MELRLILGGDYSRRLCVRKNDDFYIRSFISDVNRLLDIFEGKYINMEELRKEINSELLHLMSLIEKESVSRQKLREELLSIHKKIESMLKD